MKTLMEFSLKFPGWKVDTLYTFSERSFSLSPQMCDQYHWRAFHFPFIQDISPKFPLLYLFCCIGCLWLWLRYLSDWWIWSESDDCDRLAAPLHVRRTAPLSYDHSYRRRLSQSPGGGSCLPYLCSCTQLCTTSRRLTAIVYVAMKLSYIPDIVFVTKYKITFWNMNIYSEFRFSE